jgi:hypothetical protein
MSDTIPPNHEAPEKDSHRGPSLVLIFGLLGVALVAAMAIAALIVLPFYRHR